MKKILFFVFLVYATISINAQSIEDLRRYFNYDPSEDLNYRVLQTIDTIGATIFNIQYTGGNEMPVTAYLIIPKNYLRRYPAVIFLHGFGQDKNTFLSNALELAEKSFATLLLDDPSARPNAFKMNYQNYTEPKRDLVIHRQSVIDVRRGIDLLEQHPRIDPERIAFVGIDYGSWTGAIVSGVEFRILTYILMDCPIQPTLDLLNSNEPIYVKVRNSITSEQLSQYEIALKKLDPVNYLGYHRNSNILFQFAQTDPGGIDANIRQTTVSTSEPKTIQTFSIQASQLINDPEALQKRKKWLYNHL